MSFLLSSEQPARLFSVPVDAAEMTRDFVLSAEDGPGLLRSFLGTQLGQRVICSYGQSVSKTFPARKVVGVSTRTPTAR
jgi:hypothetical protein